MNHLARITNRDNLAIARWLGRRGLGIKDWASDDNMALKLLPELVKRKYIPTLQFDVNLNSWKMHIAPKPFGGHDRVIIIRTGATLAASVVNAVLQLPEVKQIQEKVKDKFKHEIEQIVKNANAEGVHIPELEGNKPKLIQIIKDIEERCNPLDIETKEVLREMVEGSPTGVDPWGNFLTRDYRIVKFASVYEINKEGMKIDNDWRIVKQ
jgi:hypothetical protein